jgi:hypothetical protein
MTRMRPVPVEIAPRFAVGLRDWYRTQFAAPVGAAGATVQPIAPVLSKVRFLASSVGDPHWPFGRPVELAMQGSPTGLFGFHGRIRSAEGVLFARDAFRLRERTRCRLTIEAEGFQPHVTDADIPAPGEPTHVLPPIDLYPGVNYPNLLSAPRGAALEGAVRRTDGSGMAGAIVRLLTIPPPGPSIPIPAVSTGTDGRYLLTLDGLLAGLLDEQGTTLLAKIDIEIAHPDWPAAVRHAIPLESVPATRRFRPPRRFVAPTTTLRGQVLRGGRPAAGAVVSLESAARPLLNAAVRTDVRGEWLYFGDARLPLSGSEPLVKLTIAAGNQSVEKTITLEYGRRRDHEVTTLP